MTDPEHSELITISRPSTPPSRVDAAGVWLVAWLAREGGLAERGQVESAGTAAGHSIDSLKRARRRLGILSENRRTFPRTTVWELRARQFRDAVSLVDLAPTVSGARDPEAGCACDRTSGISGEQRPTETDAAGHSTDTDHKENRA